METEKQQANEKTKRENKREYSDGKKKRTQQATQDFRALHP